MGVNTAAIYCRISDDRAGAGLGVARQRADCEALAARLGWPIAGTLTDNDLSAYSGKPRPGYRRLLDGLAGRQYDAVVCWHPDRLHRSPAELEEFITVVETAKASVATVTAGELELSTPTGRMTARIVGAVARQESEHKAERIRRERAHRVEQGKPHPGPRAFGFEEGNVTLREPEAAMIRSAAEAVLSGRSIRSVADAWNAAGSTTARGNRWTVGAITDLLTSERIAGLRVHQGEVVGEATWPAILPRETWERLLALARARRRSAGRPPTRLLSGIARCGRCGEPMRLNGGKRNHVYACKRVPGNSLACGRLSVHADHLDAEVRDQVIAALASGRLKSVLEAQPSDLRHRDRVAALEADEAALVVLAQDHYVDRLIGKAEFLAAREQLDRRIVTTRAELAGGGGEAPFLRALPTFGAELCAWWETAPGDLRRALVKALIERVDIAPIDSSKPRRFDPERANVTWRA